MRRPLDERSRYFLTGITAIERACQDESQVFGSVAIRFGYLPLLRPSLDNQATHPAIGLLRDKITSVLAALNPICGTQRLQVILEGLQRAVDLIYQSTALA